MYVSTYLCVYKQDPLAVVVYDGEEPIAEKK